MNLLIDRWHPSAVVLFGTVLALRLLRRLGLRSSEDGWRRATRAYFRTEEAKYVLGVFRLDYRSDRAATAPSAGADAELHLASRLANYLTTQPVTHWSLDWSRFSAWRKPLPTIYVVRAGYAADGALVSLGPVAAREPTALPETVRQAALEEIVKAFNATRDLPDKSRPYALKRLLNRRLAARARAVGAGPAELQTFAWSVLGGIFISFSTASSDASSTRFDPPDFTRLMNPGFSFLNIHCRFSADRTEADLFVQVSHLPSDGVPVQEALTALKAAWGTRGPLELPANALELRPAPQPSSRAPVFHAQRYVDFRPLLEARREFNDRFARRAGGDITAVSLIVWGLAQHPAMPDLKYLITVDLPAAPPEGPGLPERQRTVGLVLIRPTAYSPAPAGRHRFGESDGGARDPEAAFLRFEREFNRRLAETRQRRSESYELVESYALAPPPVFMVPLRLMPGGLGEMIGTIGISVIKDAEFFIGPLSDVHTDGFLAFGRFRSPTADGEEAGIVSAKGSERQVTTLLQALSDLAGDPYAYLPPTPSA